VERGGAPIARASGRPGPVPSSRWWPRRWASISGRWAWAWPATSSAPTGAPAWSGCPRRRRSAADPLKHSGFLVTRDGGRVSWPPIAASGGGGSTDSTHRPARRRRGRR